MRFFIHVVHTISTLAIRGEVYFGVNLKSLREVANKLKKKGQFFSLLQPCYGVQINLNDNISI